MLNFGRYAKTITAEVTGILGWFAVVIAASPTHFHVTLSQWLALGVVEATALGVYGMPNTTPSVNPPSEPPVLPPVAK